MKIDAKPGIQPTKNPNYFQMSLPVSDEQAKEAKVSHGGRAFTTLSKDELKALFTRGLKPFCRFTGEVTITERTAKNEDGSEKLGADGKPKTILDFDFADEPHFVGGFGGYEDILTAAPSSSKSAPANF